MAEPTSAAVQPAPVGPGQKVDVQRERIFIRSYPKTIFLYPLAVVSLVCGILEKTGWVGSKELGFVFATVLFFNLVIVSFEFRKHTPVVLLLVTLVAVLGGVLLNEKIGLTYVAGLIYGSLSITASPQLYLAVAGALGTLFLCIAINSRFDYWEVRPNEVLHHQGVLGDLERFPAPSLTMRKEIVDVFEYLLLGAGRLIIFPSGRNQAIVLENVPRINAVEERMSDLLDAMQVTIENPSSTAGPPPHA